MGDVQRSVLPIPDQVRWGLTTYDAKDPDTSLPPIRDVRPPLGAPNVLVILLDDVGFGASSAFGGPCHTPVAERLAAGGLRYNRFHTTALCAPTRAALLTGRNHHSVGMGNVTELATPAPGYTSLRPNSKAPLPETLKRRLQRQGMTVHEHGQEMMAEHEAVWLKFTGPLKMTHSSPRMTRIEYFIPLGDGRALELRIAAPPAKFEQIAPLMKQSIRTFRLDGSF